ncbi:MAG: phosphoribosylformylglycinamidine synthase subunit PurS [Gemmatimonadota bacterium]|nr:phosphoribosylformylglycinamidine synthase subunit PurS [Gemmatimonadota bacterium]
MSRFRLEIRVVPRPGLLDPEGKAIQSALHSLDYEQVHEVRVGKLLYLNLEAASREDAREGAEAMCKRLLANPVTEDFEIDVREAVEQTVPA